jgi:hypothetical protein
MGCSGSKSVDHVSRGEYLVTGPSAEWAKAMYQSVEFHKATFVEVLKDKLLKMEGVADPENPGKQVIIVNKTRGSQMWRFTDGKLTDESPDLILHVTAIQSREGTATDFSNPRKHKPISTLQMHYWFKQSSIDNQLTIKEEMRHLRLSIACCVNGKIANMIKSSHQQHFARQSAQRKEYLEKNCGGEVPEAGMKKVELFGN